MRSQSKAGSLRRWLGRELKPARENHHKEIVMKARTCIVLGLAAVVAVWAAGSVLAVDPASSGTLGTNAMIFRSTQLEGLNVYNRANTDAKLGHLSDLIIDAHTGRVLYGILDTGIGGKYIPVPWSGFQVQEDAQARKSWLTLNKTSDELKNSPTYDKNSPPDFVNSDWRNTVDRFFGVRTVARPKGSGDLTANELIFRSSQLEKLSTYNRTNQNDRLGSLDDLIVDSHTGQVMYGVLSTGMMGKNIPVPWTALTLHEGKDHKSWLTLTKTNDELKNAPTIDLKRLPDFTSAQWKKSVNDFFGVSMM
jgi:hypothetical protein